MPSASLNPADYAIFLDEVAKRYGDREAVKGVTLGIRPGEFFGLLGPNGAGKTTTLGMLAGFIEPDRGRIMLFGQSAWPRTPELKRKLGLVPQDFAFYPTLSARDNLAFFGAIFDLRGRALAHRIDAVLDIAGLRDRDREPVAHFSGGMKRRLNIAIGLLHEPRILLLDEPTVGVDAQSRGAILDALEELHRSGMTLIYSTHYMEEAARLCRRVAILDHGRLVAYGSPRKLTQGLGERVVEVEFGAALPDNCLGQIQALGATVVASDEGRSLSLASSGPELLLQALFDIARRHGLPIRNLRLSDPTLETVFLKLTGRQLRD